MSWHFLPELVGESSPECSTDGAPSARSRSSRTAGKCFSDASGTACFPCSRSGTTSEPSTADRGVASWMSSLAASRASRSPSPASDSPTRTNGTSGPRRSAYLGKLDPATHSWRTSQVSLLTPTSDASSLTLPRWGTTRRGELWVLTTWAPPTSGSGSGSWLTPTAMDAKPSGAANPYVTESGSIRHRNKAGTSSNLGLARQVKWTTPQAHDSTPGDASRVGRFGTKHGGRNLNDEVAAAQKWPTPTTRDHKDGTAQSCANVPENGLLGRVVHRGNPTPQMTLNPAWVEWLMAWPIGFTDLRPLEMDKFRSWLRSHGASSPTRCERAES